MTDRLAQSYAILEKLRLPNNAYLASSSSEYSYIWLRDLVYEVHCYLDKPCDTYQKSYHAILDMLRSYEWKLDHHIKHKPIHKHEYIHARYDAYTFREVDVEWGHKQNDNIGEILFGIGEGIKAGKPIIRDQKDHEIVQKLVWYLETLEYYQDFDSGQWEENEEVRTSSIGACVAGLQAVREVVFVPRELILKGYSALAKLFPMETETRAVDAAQLSLIYPYKILFDHDAQTILDRVETVLNRRNGICRYLGDSYFSTKEGRHHPLPYYYCSEAEWTMFLPWMSLCFQELGNYEKAKEYIERTEAVMLEDGRLPELYYSNSDRYNENTPLGWSQSLYIQAKEKYMAHVEGE